MLYPNPVNTTLTVELTGTETIEWVSLQTLTGSAVVQSIIRARQRMATLDIGHLPKGLYFLQIQTPTRTANKKVVKE